MYSTGSWLGCKILLFGRLWNFHCERKTFFFFSERKHGERESSSQNVTQYRKLLAMRKFFFFFSLVLISLCLSVWLKVFLTLSMPKVVYFTFLYYLSRGNSWVYTSAHPVSPPQRILCFCTMSKIKKKKNPDLVEDRLLNSSFFFFLPF